jgi:hypothetical protein
VFFDTRYKKLTGFFNGDNNQQFENIDRGELQEAQMVYEQMKWLLELSVKLERTIKETRFI